MIKKRSDQQGVVIIVALFIVALVATLSYVMMARFARDTARSTLILRNVEAEQYAQGSIDWSKDQLRNNAVGKKPDQLIERMPLKSPVNTVNGFEIASTVYDMQARFNINNLTQGAWQDAFKRFLRIINPDMNVEQATVLTSAIVDWISPLAQQKRIFTKYYSEQKPPYRAAHRPMQSVSELKLVKGMTPSLYARLKPYLIALPWNEATFNINTMPTALFLMLSNKIDPGTAKVIYSARKQKLFINTQEFLKLPILKSRGISDLGNEITVQSNYFLVETTVRIEEQKLTLYTLLERTGSGDKVLVTTLWQSKGIW